jgi:hypothetical protein
MVALRSNYGDTCSTTRPSTFDNAIVAPPMPRVCLQGDQPSSCAERQVGSFIGGMGLNTTLAFGALLLVIVGGFIATGGEASISKILLPALGMAVFLPVMFYARSRLLWVAFELIWWPLLPNETNEVR